LLAYSSDRDSIATDSRALNKTFATLTYNLDGIVIGANNSFSRMSGYGLEEIVGQSNASLFLSESAGYQVSLWADLVSGTTRETTSLFTTRGGERLWLRSQFVPLADPDGSISHVIQLATDISSLQAQEAENRGQIDAINANVAILHLSLDGEILDVNDRFLNVVGYDRGALIGQHHRLLVAPAYAASGEYKKFWSDLAAGCHQAGEYRGVGSNGREIWLQASYNPIFDPSGRLIKIVKYANDITSEKLRQIDYQWQVRAIHKSHSVITFDMTGAVLDANEQFLSAMDYTLEEVQGRHHRMFVEPAYAHGSEYAEFWKELREGHHRSGQYKRLARNGRAVWLQATYNPIFDMNGRVIKVVKYATVITEARRQQAEHQGQIAAIHQAQCVISFDLDGTIIDANENFLDAVGYRFSQVQGQHHRMFIDDAEAGSKSYADFWAALASGQHQAGEFKRYGRDGREVWLQATYNPIFDIDGRPFKIVKYATDVTEQKLRQTDYQCQIEAISKSQGVVTLDLDGNILEMNANFLDILGYASADVVGKPHRMLVEHEFAESDAYGEFWATLRRGEFHSGMFKRIGKDGRQVWIQASYNPILDFNGQPVKVIKFATDVTSNVALAEAFDDAKRQAHHDAATSLPNRVKLASFMSAALISPTSNLTVFYIDLDRFKPINDTFGHHVGDRVLGEVADRMRRALRGEQIVARVGGDEFVIAAPDLPAAQIESFCQRLFELVTAPIRHESGEISVGMSIGIAMSPSDGTTPDELLRAADAALYRSKENGRGTYSFFATEMNDRIVAHRQLAEDMRRGIVNNEFYLQYQPRFDTRARTIKSVEALVRWTHPERGLISPGDFIPLAEQNGLIVPLGDWILQAACNSAAAWGDIGVSVNVSPVQFRDGNLVATVRSALTSSGLPAEKLELEITEGVLLEDADKALTVLNGLKDLGVTLAMDDFGTGYSSLSYLRNFPFDVIKIDRSFISDLETRQSSRSIVQAILGLGKALGMSVTAEGVETNEQLAMLTMDQCAEVQGFLLARPLHPGQVAELLKELPELLLQTPATSSNIVVLETVANR